MANSPAPKALHVVDLRAEGPDLSGMTALERAEFLQRTERERMIDEIARQESNAIRGMMKLMIVSSAAILGLFLAFAVFYLVKVDRPSFAGFRREIIHVVIAMAVLAALITLFGCLTYGRRWWQAVLRRRVLMEGKGVREAMNRAKLRRAGRPE